MEGGLRDGHQGGGEARLCTVNSFTQINPWDGKNLGRESVRKQVEGCLSRLQVLSSPYCKGGKALINIIIMESDLEFVANVATVGRVKFVSAV